MCKDTGRLQHALLMFNVVFYFETYLYNNSPFVVTRKTLAINKLKISSIFHAIRLTNQEELYDIKQLNQIKNRGFLSSYFW